MLHTKFGKDWYSSSREENVNVQRWAPTHSNKSPDWLRGPKKIQIFCWLLQIWTRPPAPTPFALHNFIYTCIWKEATYKYGLIHVYTTDNLYYINICIISIFTHSTQETQLSLWYLHHREHHITRTLSFPYNSTLKYIHAIKLIYKLTSIST